MNSLNRQIMDKILWLLAGHRSQTRREAVLEAVWEKGKLLDQWFSIICNLQTICYFTNPPHHNPSLQEEKPIQYNKNDMFSKKRIF
jgi:hypothetical protein